jgi:hypothetical protein
VKINNFNLQLEQIENNMEQKNKKIKKKRARLLMLFIIILFYDIFNIFFFFLFNVGVRASLRAPRLISRALKLTTM